MRPTVAALHIISLDRVKSSLTTPILSLFIKFYCLQLLHDTILKSWTATNKFLFVLKILCFIRSLKYINSKYFLLKLWIHRNWFCHANIISPTLYKGTVLREPFFANHIKGSAVQTLMSGHLQGNKGSIAA